MSAILLLAVLRLRPFSRGGGLGLSYKTRASNEIDGDSARCMGSVHTSRIAQQCLRTTCPQMIEKEQ